MGDPIELSVSEKFEKERMMRAIDSIDNIEELKVIAKEVFSAWLIQRAASRWIIKSSLVPPERKV
jgi:hypothetical protein